MPSKHKESKSSKKDEHADAPSFSDTKKAKGRGKKITKQKRPPRVDTSRYAANPILGMTKAAVKRMARRSGISRMSMKSVDGLREVTKIQIDELTRTALESMRSDKRSTIIPADIILAAKLTGHNLVGYN